MPHIGNFFDPTRYLEGTPTDGEVKKGPTSNWAFDHKAAPDDHHAPPELPHKVLEIGDWDMNGTTNIAVAHGLTLGNIRAVQVMVRKDDASFLAPFCADIAISGFDDGYFTLSVSDITLYRKPGGQFDNTDYDTTPYNRGWIVIWHVP